MSPSGGLAVRSTGIHQAGVSGAANATEGEPILKIKISLRFAMIMISIGACFMPMLGGILGLSSYDTYRLQEKKYRDALPDLRRREGVAKFVTELERGAVTAAENAHKSREASTTARVLVGLSRSTKCFAHSNCDRPDALKPLVFGHLRASVGSRRPRIARVGERLSSIGPGFPAVFRRFRAGLRIAP